MSLKEKMFTFKDGEWVKLNLSNGNIVQGDVKDSSYDVVVLAQAWRTISILRSSIIAITREDGVEDGDKERNV